VTDTSWKRAERTVARDFGLRRIGTTGRDTPDAAGGVWCIEVKWRTKLPQWLWSALDSIRAKAHTNQAPLVVLCERNRKRRMVLMDYGDFLDWFGGGDFDVV